ncbi:sigma-70 family RNA polymerase sigma factor [Nonomuraea sp. NPDC050790]|uniref:sigma-70 family RNA polymerase sigma factor n=1 Tax=Nonomuraea sp. NPDC050790 TaxID=3364371 RepID=UPI0037B1D50D
MSEPTDEFVLKSTPYRGELLALCYRMLGSFHEAEDAVQETYLRAWRSYDGFEGRASMRTWLYKIATRTCLRSLEKAARRPLPSGLSAPSGDPEGPLAPGVHDIAWLQPFRTEPAERSDPALLIENRAGLRLALIAALQHLPPRRRAVLILRDVLEWRAAEVADLLGTTATAVNSLLQHARAQLKQVDSTPPPPLDARQRELLDRYAAAFEKADISGLTSILAEDAVWEMPPYPTWFVGRENIVRFLATRLTSPGATKVISTEVNTQPAFALHTADGPHALHVLTLSGDAITRVVAFMDQTTLNGVVDTQY